MRYLWTEDAGAGLHFWKLVNQLFFDNELAVESKGSNHGLLDALIDLETEDGDEYFVAFDYVVDNQDMLSNVKWGKYIIGDLFERIETAKLPYKTDELPKQPCGEYVIPCLTSSFRNQGFSDELQNEVKRILEMSR